MSFHRTGWNHTGAVAGKGRKVSTGGRWLLDPSPSHRRYEIGTYADRDYDYDWRTVDSITCPRHQSTEHVNAVKAIQINTPIGEIREQRHSHEKPGANIQSTNRINGSYHFISRSIKNAVRNRAHTGTDDDNGATFAMASDSSLGFLASEEKSIHMKNWFLDTEMVSARLAHKVFLRFVGGNVQTSIRRGEGSPSAAVSRSMLAPLRLQLYSLQMTVNALERRDTLLDWEWQRDGRERKRVRRSIKEWIAFTNQEETLPDGGKAFATRIWQMGAGNPNRRGVDSGFLDWQFHGCYVEQQGFEGLCRTSSWWRQTPVHGNEFERATAAAKPSLNSGSSI
ncbi:hypothetical protein BJ165DRAFT_1405788 [Panaeolus papilionaceus]|nr:hypothetical protein BJ165DRAFT_1405788 [Panaeolus papilionaceus]